jgi:hypothetical protein
MESRVYNNHPEIKHTNKLGSNRRERDPWLGVCSDFQQGFGITHANRALSVVFSQKHRVPAAS